MALNKASVRVSLIDNVRTSEDGPTCMSIREMKCATCVIGPERGVFECSTQLSNEIFQLELMSGGIAATRELNCSQLESTAALGSGGSRVANFFRRR